MTKTAPVMYREAYRGRRHAGTPGDLTDGRHEGQPHRLVLPDEILQG
jgi:hypothetical protein